MAEFTFEPPITLKPGIVVSTLDDAPAFVRSHQGSRRPPMQQAILRRLERATSAEERREAADAFRGWAVIEGLIV